MRRIGSGLALLAAVGILAACGGGGTAPAGPDPQRLVLGVVPVNEVDRLLVDAGTLGELLSAELRTPVRTQLAESEDALVAALGSGQADVGLLGPVALVRSVEEAGAVPVLQTVRRGAPTRQVQWLTDDPARFCATPVVRLTDPGGRVRTHCNGTDSAAAGPVGEEALAGIVEGEPVVFVGEGSAAGHHLPATQLERVTGIDPLTGTEARFAADDPASVLAVARGDASVGVSAVDARADAVPDDPETGSPVTVFARSPGIPHDGVAVRGDLPAGFRQRVADAMAAVIATPRGARAFAAVYSVEGLVPVDPAALAVAREVAADSDRW